MNTQLTDAELYQVFCEAELRKSDHSLPIDVRIRSNETCALCLQEAWRRGMDYTALRARALAA